MRRSPMMNPSVTRISVFGASMFLTASIKALSEASVMSPSDVLWVATVYASLSTTDSHNWRRGPVGLALALAGDDSFERARLAALDGQRLAQRHRVAAGAALLQLHAHHLRDGFLQTPAVGGEGRRRRTARAEADDRHPVGRLQMLEEAVDGAPDDHGAAEANVRLIDDEHDQAAARRVLVGGVSRRRRRSVGLRRRHERDPLGAHHAPRRPVDLDGEVVGPEVLHRPAAAVDDADVHRCDLDRRAEHGRLRLLRMERSRERPHEREAGRTTTCRRPHAASRSAATAFDVVHPLLHERQLRSLGAFVAIGVARAPASRPRPSCARPSRTRAGDKSTRCPCTTPGRRPGGSTGTDRACARLRVPGRTSRTTAPAVW